MGHHEPPTEVREARLQAELITTNEKLDRLIKQTRANALISAVAVGSFFGALCLGLALWVVSFLDSTPT